MDWSSLLTFAFIALMFFLMMRHGGGRCGGGDDSPPRAQGKDISDKKTPESNVKGTK
jgi:hypothetical protein